MILIILIVLVVLFAGGGFGARYGNFGGGAYRGYGTGGIGLGTILLIVLVVYLLMGR